LDVEVWESAAATTEMFEERLANAPRCTFIAEANGGVCGSTSFCLLDYEGFEAAGHTTWYDLTGDGTASTHDTSGKDLFGINLVVSKRAPKDTSTALLLEVVRAGVKAGVRRGLLGARLPGYHKIADQMSIDDYAWAKRDDGLPLDPQIRFYRRMGLRPIRLVKDYFVDPESLDYGMIVEMKNPFFRPAPVRAFGRMLASLPIDLAKVIDRLI
jgi:hypothetical protein